MRFKDDQIQINESWYHITPRDSVMEAIDDLCRINPDFNQFFNNEVQPNLNLQKIFWVINPSLKLLGLSIPDDKNIPPLFHCIILQRFPQVPDDEFIISHEIGHCVFNERKFPIISPDRNLMLELSPKYAQPIFTVFNSMIFDNTVNAKLKKYHLDLTPCIEKNLKGIQINNKFELIYRTFRYVIKRRCARLLIDLIPEYECILLAWYYENLPMVMEIGDKIFEILERSPSEYPEEILLLVQQIASLYQWRADSSRDGTTIWIRIEG
jgi:hypothetical protein